ncbi:hypothetical protein GT516_06680 [Collinsella sp. BIOML-A4]|nr:hypothetical protein [Collinsella sp. BIOML-A2]MZJ29525.1 hypothetical protein [Collinsella sp. BIOML-A3]MZJ33374.1 hypothetical protein [Collinsella sp. BIOML-A1]MZJ97086.1 hypothetical protein [Collinsella sp. BIOML-A6]MZK30970.1 hypothetical protein [Collinsella sp. BIOML-A5]MZK66389.1 hypothetical protein [Collinsella sp. BIOML-A4]
MLILKKINNNVALAASDDGREVVVFGKGIGFHEMPYKLADESLIQRKFYNVPESLQDMVGPFPTTSCSPRATLPASRRSSLAVSFPVACPLFWRITCSLSFSATTTSSALPTRSSTRWPSSTRANSRSARPRSLSCKSTPASSWVRTRPRASRSTSLTPRSTAWAAPRTWTSS